MNPVRAYYNKSYTRKTDSKSVIYVGTILARNRIQFSSGILVSPDEWDDERECVKECNPYAKDYNLIINNIKARITQIFVRYKLQFEQLTPERLKYEFELSESSESFHTYAEFKLEEHKEKLEQGTYRRHKSQLSKIKEFRPELAIKDLDAKFVESYISWMRKVKKNKQTSIRSSTNLLKVYVNFAVKDRMLKQSPFSEVKISEGNSYREFLTEEELKKVLALYKSNRLPETHKSVIRIFLFSCYTGLRLSDVRQLTPGDIQKGEIFLAMHKTRNSSGRIVRIPLNNQAYNLIKESENGTDMRKPIFGTITEYRTNIALKESLEILKLNKKISFHCARHTFATIFLRKTNNLLALKELLGHSKIEQTLIYSHLIRTDLETDIKCFDKL